jgi:hypothetical protein
MKRIEKLRAYFQQPERPPRKKKLSAATEQRSAPLAKRKIEVLSKARAMLKQVEKIAADGECDQELRRMRDALVEELWAMRNTRREVKGQPVKVLQ